MVVTGRAHCSGESAAKRFKYPMASSSYTSDPVKDASTTGTKLICNGSMLITMYTDSWKFDIWSLFSNTSNKVLYIDI